MEKHPAPTSERGSPRSFDPDTGASLIAERLVGEIFGWDLVDWPAVERHKGRKFFFGRQRERAPSIHDRLKPLFDRCDPARNDFSALKPSPVVNANLSRLVGHLCRHVGRDGLAADETQDMALERTAEQERLQLAVVDRLVARIDGDPMLRDRSVLLKGIAGAAENELEKHAADLIDERLESGFLPGGIPDRYKIDGLREQARGRVEETRLLNQREMAGLAMPLLDLDDEALVRMEMVKILLGRFPYVRNYELMLLTELAMLQRPLTPRFVRERMLSSRRGAIDMAAVMRLDGAIAGAIADVSRDWQATLPSPDRTIAICGSGPLPMTALFLHLMTGASIVLVDRDRSAIERSTRLIGNLERLGVLEPGALTVRHENAGDAVFHDRARPPKRAGGTTVACDAVLIASLVDADAKRAIAERFRDDPRAPPLLVMRSATGLSARLAYDPVPTEAFSRGRLAYCGETVPATQVATHLDRAEAIRRRVACRTSPDVLAIAHPDVVNTTEVYRRISPPGGGFDACTTIEDWVRSLEKVGNAPTPGEL